MSAEEWLALEIEDCPHLAEEELVMFKREFGLEVLEREVAEGKAEGKAEGEAEGLAKGKLEARRDIAISLLKQGIPEDTICSTTKLSRKEVQLLKKSL